MIFISYRREDAKAEVTHLARRLKERYGDEQVFVDFYDIPLGARWPDELRCQLASRKILLAVVGRQWGQMRSFSGTRAGDLRLDDPADWVRQEVCMAVRDRKKVVVVRVDDACLPETEWQPPECELNQLSTFQSTRLRNLRDFDADFAWLCDSLERDVPELKTAPTLVGKRAVSWTPEIVYPLQPAPHFAGRKELLAELAEWARAGDDPTRVVSLVAAGGTGKTALAERVLDSLRGYTAAGVFVWSFYEDQQTESFLRQAHAYFGEHEEPERASTGGLLDRLNHRLRASGLPHLLVLDGLELVQATGASGCPLGGLEDPLLKRFLRWVATGHGTRTKALITSRFPLPDLADWTDRGFRSHALEDLDLDAARAVLRRRGVRGSDADLDDLGESVHRHALTVDVLGSYLGTFHDGDPTAAPSFDPEFLADTDLKTDRLHRVLTRYAQQLLPQERDLLARLSMFPRGIGLGVINSLVAAGGAVAGALARCEERAVRKILERLQKLGLVFRYTVGREPTFTAHPFLRGFFEKLLGGVDPRQVYKRLSRDLAAGLEARPDQYPTELVDLDRYERLIEATRLSGAVRQSFELYAARLGGFWQLGKRLGENARGARILAGFSADGTPLTTTRELNLKDRLELIGDWARYAENLGNVHTVRQAVEATAAIQRERLKCMSEISIKYEASLLAEHDLHVAGLEINTGQWLAGWDRVQHLATYEYLLQSKVRQKYHALRAAVCAGLGQVGEAAALFAAAREGDHPLVSTEGVREAEFKLMAGRVAAAREQCLANKIWSLQCGATDVTAVCDTLLGKSSLTGDCAEAAGYLASAREYADRTGNVEVTLRCYHLAAEIARQTGRTEAAVSEAADGISLADSCGFGRWSLNIRLELAKIHLVAGRPVAALEPALWVLKRSQERDCKFAWGAADALHVLGVAHARLGKMRNARKYLEGALRARDQLAHPSLPETKRELGSLGYSLLGWLGY